MRFETIFELGTSDVFYVRENPAITIWSETIEASGKKVPPGYYQIYEIKRYGVIIKAVENFESFYEVRENEFVIV